MKTKILSVSDIEEAARALLEGELIAFPTETVYGLGADATNEKAVSKIYQAKGRPSDNPLIAHVSSVQMLERITDDLSSDAKGLIKRFWPGPLTLVVKHNGSLADSVTAGLETVGVRMPAHPIAQNLIDQLGRPIAAPSANRSGRPSPTTAEHVFEDLQGRIYGVIDGGMTQCGVESTVLDMTSDVPTILRPGAITSSDLLTVLNEVIESTEDFSDSDKKNGPKAPGMKYQHYSPNIPVYLPHLTVEKSVELLREKYQEIGILADDSYADYGEESGVHFYSLGEPGDVRSANHHLFAGLRSLEKSGAEVILAQTYPGEEAGRAYMNRLHKAAGGKMI